MLNKIGCYILYGEALKGNPVAGTLKEVFIMTSGIYKITNKLNGKSYIGQSNDIERRIAEHKKKRILTTDDYINFYGVDNFSFEILEKCEQSELDNKEKEYIKQYNSIEDGYNIQKGGYNNSIGEGNGRAKLTEKEVIEIRKAYAAHISPSLFYEKYFKEKLTKSAFQSVWQGLCWRHIMPEVFTPENKQYYIKEMMKLNASLTKEEVLQYRIYFINHTLKEVYEKYLIEHPNNSLKQNTFQRIIQGDVRKESIYKEIPVYNKKIKQWIDKNGAAVSTISVSGE